MANPLKGEAPLGELTLAYEFGTFCELEHKAGMKMPQLMTAVQDGLGFNELHDFVWAGLRKHHPMNDAEVNDLLNKFSFQDAVAAVVAGVSSYFGEQKEKDENPPKAK